MTKKTEEHYNTILQYMEPERWYKSDEITEVLNLKETRTKELLKDLIEEEKIIDDGSTKGKRYKLI